MVFMDTLITVSILAMDTMGRCLNVGQSGSITSRATKRAMGAATWAMLRTMRAANARCPDTVAVVVTAARLTVTRDSHNLNEMHIPESVRLR
jgi:hypothetical protein